MMDQAIASYDQSVDELSSLLMRQSSAFAVGWLGSMLKQVSTDSDIRLSKRQLKALQKMVDKNIGWATNRKEA